MKSKTGYEKYFIGEVVVVYIELPYNESDEHYGVVTDSTSKFVTVKLRHPHYKFPNGYVKKHKKFIRKV